MRVEPATAAGSAEHEGRPTTSAAKGCLNRFQTDPKKYLDPAYRPGIHAMHARARAADRSSGRASLDPPFPPPPIPHPSPFPRLHLPDAPGGASAWPGSCPICGMALEPVEVTLEESAEPRARGHDRRFWVVARPDRADPRLHGLGVPARSAAASSRAGRRRLDRVRARDAGRHVGRMAVLRARLGVDRQPHLNMFTLIALGVGRRVRLQRRRDDRCPAVPDSFQATRARSAVYFEAGGGHRRARAARAGAGAARARAGRARDPEAARPRPKTGADRATDGAEHDLRSSTSTSAIGSAFGPARRCRWTASCSRGRPPWTSPW